MMNQWLSENEKGTFTFTGLVDPSDDTVVTPQATCDYGDTWFSISDGPAILHSPIYDRFFSVSIFDMKHNIPAVITNPSKPICIKRPGQTIPEGDFYVVELETDQGLAFTRMIVVDNFNEVRDLSKEITMQGGQGNMYREVQRFSPEVEEKAHRVIDAIITGLNPDDAFGKTSGDISFLDLAAGVKLGQLGTPPDTVRYAIIASDSDGNPLNGEDTYEVTIAPDIVTDAGYYSVTLYGTDNKLLIPNQLEVYDRTTYSSKPNEDGSYTLTFSPSGAGKNGIPTGKDFYGILRAYVPQENADMSIHVIKK